MRSKIETIYRRHDTDRVCQGDLFEEFVYPEWISREGNKIKIKNRNIPYLIVLTQDCDLERDHVNHITNSEKQDKYLQSILVCPAYQADKLKNGTHLEKLGYKMEYQNSDRWKIIMQNNNHRYHYLEAFEQIPALTIDFKHYYSIPRDIIYNEIKNDDHYLGTVNELFRESLSQRFAYYLSRIGLPEIVKDEE
ncbi:hypothetical protein FGU46_03095 [Methanobacterium sp. CWC-01]|uniref:hypothetical protein n=1 Tax=Methanobacterium aridiramus TaxID=2584467 RepID=UPI002578F96B|nr:hypothetical protein [Methanobacterium sp. CWC-01]WJI09146.1 hypothetical protein FGU46_03095 [Methanobacterium sp. CWC-01]